MKLNIPMKYPQLTRQDSIILAAFTAVVNAAIISVSTWSDSIYTLHPLLNIYFYFLLFIQLFADAINNRARKVMNELALAQTLGCICIFFSLTVLGNFTLMLLSGPISWGVVAIYLRITRGNINGLAFHVVWGSFLAGLGLLFLPYLLVFLVGFVFLKYENYTQNKEQQIDD